jgi:hypothetical protein
MDIEFMLSDSLEVSLFSCSILITVNLMSLGCQTQIDYVQDNRGCCIGCRRDVQSGV